jgi:type II secretory pathway component PulF
MDRSFPTFRKLTSGESLFRHWWPWRTLPFQSRSLLGLIAVATEQHLPFAPLLEAWAEDERGAQRGRVRRLAALLKKGMPLPDAVEEVTGALRDADVLAIRFGVQSGTLAASLQEARDESSMQRPTALLRWTFAYTLLVTLISVIIVSFINIKIMPSVRYILEDFSMDAPLALKWSLRFAEIMENYWFVFVLFGLLLAWSAVSARPGRFLRHSLLGKYFWPLRNLRSAEILEKLSGAASAGRPMAGAISTLARYHFDSSTRRKLLFVRNEMEQGSDVWRSLEDAGLLTAPEENLLTSADRVGNRPWTLHRLAACKKRRTWRTLERMSEMVLPAVVVLLGAFVLFQALAIFMPLVQIVTNLSKPQ